MSHVSAAESCILYSSQENAISLDKAQARRCEGWETIATARPRDASCAVAIDTPAAESSMLTRAVHANACFLLS